MLCVVGIALLATQLHVVPFERDLQSFGKGRILLVQSVFVPVLLLAVLALLHRIARAAEESHLQVRIAALAREAEDKQLRIGQLEASMGELRALLGERTA